MLRPLWTVKVICEPHLNVRVPFANKAVADGMVQLTL